MRYEFTNYLDNLLDKVVKVSNNTPNAWNLVNVQGVDVSCKYSITIDSISLYMNTKLGTLLLVKDGYEKYYVSEDILFTHISYIKELNKKDKLIKGLPTIDKHPNVTINGNINIYL